LWGWRLTVSRNTDCHPQVEAIERFSPMKRTPDLAIEFISCNWSLLSHQGCYNYAPPGHVRDTEPK
jgi:hypothetical protein